MDTMSVPDSASADCPDLICVVCGDKANGMHYRALTCEGCKTFFRRNARHRDTLKCEMMNDGGCEMDMYTRRHCAACRMQKCISVGMQPDRLWDKTRLKTRKPITKKVKVKTENDEKQPPVVLPEESPAKAVDLLPELTIHHQEIARLIAVAYRSAKETLPQPPANLTGIPEPASPVPTTLDGPENSRFQPSTPMNNAFDTSPSTSALHTKGSTCQKTPLSSESPASSKCKVPQTSPRAQPCSSTLQSRTIDPASSSDLSSTSSPPRQSTASAEAASRAGKQMSPPTPHPVVHKCECGCIIHNKPTPEVEPVPVVEVSSSSVTSKLSVKTPPKEVPSEDQPGTSAVQTKAPLEGQRSLLAGGMTGHGIVPQIMEIVVLLLKHMINFAKQLPGFQTLSSDDQATLIKGALVEYMILTSCPLYDIEKGQFNSEIWPTLSIDPDQVESAGFITVMGSVMSFAVKMQKLSLKEEELALLFALAIISPDRRDLEDALKVEELQQPLVDALQTCVQVNHSNKTGHFAKIIMLLTEVRDATEAYMDDLMTIQLSGSRLNPLLEELFSD